MERDVAVLADRRALRVAGARATAVDAHAGQRVAALIRRADLIRRAAGDGDRLALLRRWIAVLSGIASFVVLAADGHLHDAVSAHALFAGRAVLVDEACAPRNTTRVAAREERPAQRAAANPSRRRKPRRPVDENVDEESGMGDVDDLPDFSTDVGDPDDRF